MGIDCWSRCVRNTNCIALDPAVLVFHRNVVDVALDCCAAPQLFFFSFWLKPISFGTFSVGVDGCRCCSRGLVRFCTIWTVPTRFSTVACCKFRKPNSISPHAFIQSPRCAYFCLNVSILGSVSLMMRWISKFLPLENDKCCNQWSSIRFESSLINVLTLNDRRKIWPKLLCHQLWLWKPAMVRMFSCVQWHIHFFWKLDVFWRRLFGFASS